MSKKVVFANTIFTFQHVQPTYYTTHSFWQAKIWQSIILSPNSPIFTPAMRELVLIIILCTQCVQPAVDQTGKVDRVPVTHFSW